MKDDVQLLQEAYLKVLNEDDSLDQYHNAQLEQEAQKSDLPTGGGRIPLAYRLFEQAFDEVSNSTVLKVHEELESFRSKNEMTYRGLVRIPFVRDLFKIIDDAYGYIREREQDETSEQPQADPNDMKDAEEALGHDGSKAERPKQPNGW